MELGPHKIYSAYTYLPPKSYKSWPHFSLSLSSLFSLLSSLFSLLSSLSLLSLSSLFSLLSSLSPLLTTYLLPCSHVHRDAILLIPLPRPSATTIFPCNHVIVVVPNPDPDPDPESPPGHATTLVHKAHERMQESLGYWILPGNQHLP
jgi:hypothetical protein